ncbi:MAG: ankyrin repeat domain-containing protein, partial [Janthinobacterium lividum]
AATRAGNFAMVELLLENGADPRLTSSLGGTILHQAAEQGRDDLATLILAAPVFDAKSRAAFVNAATMNGHNALSMAFGENRDMVAGLKAAGGDLRRIDQRVMHQVIGHAAELGNMEELRELLDIQESRVTPGRSLRQIRDQLFNFEDDEGYTVLLTALYGNQKSAAELLIARGALLLGKADAPILAIHLAAKFGHEDLVLRCIEAARAQGGSATARQQRVHALVNALSRRTGLTVLQHALLENQFFVVQALIEHGVELSSPASRPLPLPPIAAPGGPRIPANLRQGPALPAPANAALGETAADDADDDAYSDHTDITAMPALENGQMRLSMEIEHLAAMSKEARIPKLMIDALGARRPARAGASIQAFLDKCNAARETPLITAAKLGCAETVELFMAHGARLSDTDRFGNNAFHALAINDHAAGLASLLNSARHGWDQRAMPQQHSRQLLVARNALGQTPLDLAIECRAEAVLVGILRVVGVTPLHLPDSAQLFCLRTLAKRQGANLLASLLDPIALDSLIEDAPREASLVGQLKALATVGDFDGMARLFPRVDTKKIGRYNAVLFGHARAAFDSGEHRLMPQWLAQMGFPEPEVERVFASALLTGINAMATISALLPAIGLDLLQSHYPDLLELAFDKENRGEEGRNLLEVTGSMVIDRCQQFANGEVQDELLREQTQAMLSHDNPLIAKLIAATVFAAVRRHDLLLNDVPLLKALFQLASGPKAARIRAEALQHIRALDSDAQTDMRGELIQGFKVLPERLIRSDGEQDDVLEVDRAALDRLQSMGCVAEMVAALSSVFDLRAKSGAKPTDPFSLRAMLDPARASRAD